MKVINMSATKLDISTPIVLCLGYFDGLHLGHQALIKKAVSFGYPTALLTFDHSPKEKERKDHILLDEKERNEILSSLGVEYLLIQNFDDAFKNTTPEDFVEIYLKKLPIQQLVVGEDYHYGKDAKGDISLLKKYYPTFVMPILKDEIGKYSTSRIITSLKEGNILHVNEILGRAYQMEGTVIKGYQNGRKIGFETANMSLSAPYFMPKCGVYAAKVNYRDRTCLAMVNVGTHPTIHPLDTPLIEVHILHFHEEIYGEKIRIFFLDFIREERKFGSLEELEKQLIVDQKFIENRFSV